MTGNGFIGRKAILSCVERRYAEHTIDGLGKVRIQSLNALEATELANADDDVRAMQMAIVACVDENGDRIFRDADITELKVIDSRVLNELCGVIGEHVFPQGLAGN